MSDSGAIGVFDSGLGGLTVYRALRAAMPYEDFVYLADTAHLPYGAKSRESIEAYTLDAAKFCVERGCKYLVLACNTVAAQAIPALQRAYPGLPYCGVIATGAEAAARATRNGKVTVWATEGTVRADVYPGMIAALYPEAQVQMLAAGLLVALVEEGWTEGVEAEAVLRRYLAMRAPGTDTLLLGCTHFPMLMPALRQCAPPDLRIVDNAELTAQTVNGFLVARDRKNPENRRGRDAFFVTDQPERFARIAGQFLQRDIAVERVDMTE